MTTVAVAAMSTVSFPDADGHWWVCLHYVPGLRDLGCRMLWLERPRGTPLAHVPHCGVEWHHIRPPVHLPSWPKVTRPDRGVFTTVISWWGDERLTMADGSVMENNERVGFLPDVEVVARTAGRLELAAYFGEPTGHDGAGLLRFRSPDEAVEAQARVEADYERHRRVARELAETHFSARDISSALLSPALGSTPDSARFGPSLP